MKSTIITLVTATLLLSTACKKQNTCLDPYAYTYEDNVNPNGGKFNGIQDSCKYSTLVFYLLAGDSGLAYDSIFPIIMYLDDKPFDTLTLPTTTAGNIGDPLLPKSTYAQIQLTDGLLHRWLAVTSNTVIFNDSIRSSHLQFMPISITGK